jgi:hypothetical protein
LFLQEFLEAGEHVGEVVLLRSGLRDPADILGEHLFLDAFLQPGLFILFFEVVQVKDIIPQFMVLLNIVSLQVFALLLQGLFVDPADETFFSFILQHFLSRRSEGGEVVDEDAPQDVSEQHVHEDNIDHVVGEPPSLEDLHILSHLLLDVEFHHAVEHRFAVSVRVPIRIYTICVVAQGEDRKESYEGYSEERENP